MSPAYRELDLLEHKLLFVTGKGGVGKSTISAALALLAAKRGKRTLLCDVDAKGDVSTFFEQGPLSFVPREIEKDLFAMAMDTEASLREYLHLYAKVPLLGSIGPLAKIFDFVATAAPGVKEILVVGKLCWEVKEDHYDLIVVDAAASGHIVSQLMAPAAINSLVKVGLIRSQTDWMLDILADPSRTALTIVATPEEMPVAESIELVEKVTSNTPVALSAVIVNRVLPELFGNKEEEVFEAICEEQRIAELNGLVDGDVTPIMEAARLAVIMRRTRATHLERLKQALDDKFPILMVPELFTRTMGKRSITQVAKACGEELGY